MSRLLPTLLLLGLTVYALIDCVQTPPAAVRSLPKAGWLVVILFVVAIGPITWLLLGRPTAQAAGTPTTPARPRPGPARRQVAPDDDPDFLRSLDQSRSRDRDEQLQQWEDELRRRDETDGDDDPR